MSGARSGSDVTEERRHSLLEPSSPAYSGITLQRAFVVWAYYGQRNSFREVCNYFHYLEAMEEKLSEESRASSRLLELNLFNNQPLTHAYLTDNFSSLYSESNEIKQHMGKVQSFRPDTTVRKLHDLTMLQQVNVTPEEEIVEASVMIRDYCKSNGKTLDRFLREFKYHTDTCRLKTTVRNVVSYIRRKLIQGEIQLGANYTMAFRIAGGKR